VAVNKGDLIEAVASELKLSKTEAGRAVDAVLDSITKGVQQHEKVSLIGFGTFAKKHRAARAGINPITKEPIQIKASTTCGFKPSATLKDAL
jgi:DNA-binding protein HU-beta